MNAITFSFNIRSIQQLSITSDDLSYTHRCNLHIIAIALLALIGRVTGIKGLIEYGEKIVNARMDDASHLLPPLLDSTQNYEKHNLNVPHLMVDKVRIIPLDPKLYFLELLEREFSHHHRWPWLIVYKMPEWSTRVCRVAFPTA